MRYADGSLSDLTLALNEAIDELSAPIAHADGTLASATSQLNDLLVWYGSPLPPADGTLASATSTYNDFARIIKQKIFEVTSGGVTLVTMTYNDVNLRVGSIFFTVPTGITAAVKIWDDSVLVLDTTYSPGSYEENVPGNYRVIEVIDPEDQTVSAKMPPEIAWSYSEIPA